MQSWTLARRLTFGFGVVLAITTTLGATAWWQFRRVQTHARFIVADALPGVYTIGQIQAMVRDDYSELADLALSAESTRQKDQLAKMAAGAAEVGRMLKRYEATITMEEDRRLFEALAQPSQDYYSTRDAAAQMLIGGRREEGLPLLETRVRPALERYEAAVKKLVDFNKANADRAAPELDAAVRRGVVSLNFGVALALLVGIGISFLIIRSVGQVLREAVHDLRSGSEQVASAASQVASSAQNLARGSSEQAASLEETSASMEEVGASTRQNATNTERCAHMMMDAARVVGQANEALAAMRASMQGIVESSEKVSRIIKTIDEIAFQTNILALNAAVEAARAGGAGAGFAVVADEVRSLAHRSAQAASDTTTLIEESIVRARQGQGHVDQVTACMEAVTASAGGVKVIVDQISSATHQQTQGIDHVATAVSQMEKVTQATAATAEESAAASEELNAQAEGTLGVVQRLAALAGEAT